MKKVFNASESAVYLGVSRQRFYVVKEKYSLVPVEKKYNMFFYSAKDLKEIRKKLDEWFA